MEFEKQSTRTFVTLLSSLVSLGVTMAVSFFLSPFIVANLGEEANGFTQLASNFISYASLLTIALNSMAGRFITISFYQKDYNACQKYYSSVIMGNIGIFAVLLIPAIYCIIRLESIINIESVNIQDVKLLFAFVFANFFLSQIVSVFNIACYVTNTQYRQNLVTMAQTVLRALLLLAVFSLFPARLYYVSLIGLILTFLSLPVFCWIKVKTLPEIRFHPHNFDWASIRSLLSAGIWNTINQCGHLLMTGLDLLLSNLFVSPVQMGVLSIAKTIPSSIVQIGVTINSSFSPHITISYSDKDKRTMMRSLKFAIKCSSILMSIPLMVLCVYGTSFYRLWVPSMDSVQLTILSVLTCMAFIPFSGAQALYNVFTSSNKLKLNALTFIAAGFVNFILVFILLKNTSLGIYAVAGMSSLISIIRNLLFTLPYTAKILHLKWYTFYSDVAISLLICAANALICFIVQKIIAAVSWPTMILSASISVFFCLICCYLILLNKGDRAAVHQFVKARFSKHGSN